MGLVTCSNPAVAAEALRLLLRLFAPQTARTGAVPWALKEHIAGVRGCGCMGVGVWVSVCGCGCGCVGVGVGLGVGVCVDWA